METLNLAAFEVHPLGTYLLVSLISLDFVDLDESDLSGGQVLARGPDVTIGAPSGSLVLLVRRFGDDVGENRVLIQQDEVLAVLR